MFISFAAAVTNDLLKYQNLTQNTIDTLEQLRDPSIFKWQLIVLLLVVLYIYVNEWGKEKAVVIAAGAFWGMDVFNEIWNGLFLYATKTAPVWGTPGNESGFIIFAGLNIEISMMFAILGICAVKMLPKDKNLKILGIPNRIFLACFGSLTAVIIEMFLNIAGALTWEWKYWSISFPYLIFLIGYLPFFLVAYFVYDLGSLKKQSIAVACIFGFNALLILIFGFYLKWL